MRKHINYILILTAIILSSCTKKQVVIISSSECSERVTFGMERLNSVLQEAGYTVMIDNKHNPNFDNISIFVGEASDTVFQQLISDFDINNILVPGKEGFSINSKGNSIIVQGADASGSLYGCLDIVERIKKEGKIPSGLNLIDQPEMVLRGSCIGLQKTVYLPSRHVYEYPYTPENFPWFYDKELWIKYLDMMVENRLNSLYLWNGHPFASLVKLEEYPYAVEVDDETFKLNEEMFGFLTEEANKRGIWVIQMFYNIIVSKPFAEQNNLKTQDRSRPIVPIIADYTQKSIAAFIEKYPNVGLLVCLGEAMNTIDDDVEWFTKTILPGVKDGLEALGCTEEPPIVLRAHDTDGEKVMNVSLPIYKNLYTMSKYNGESLTTYEPRDSWETIPKALSKLGSVHISNVHILANLEPFRYGSPDFIQKSTQAMHDIQGANGLHLYPQASYWDWPFSADNTSPRLNEMDRDWIWYKAWSRYAWNCRRDRSEEIEYWSDELADYYGCGNAGEDILKAYEETGEIAPKLLRTFGISDGNRQTLLLGMFMSQLVNPHKYRVYSNFWPSSGPLKEVLEVYAEKEWKGEAHQGETPHQVIEDVVKRGKMAVEDIEKAGKAVTANKEEFERLKNDMYCYNAFANFFAEKVKAAQFVLRYKYSSDITDLEKALPFLEKSVAYYQELVELTKDTYLYANSMQTQQRRIPISGVNGTNKTWAELLVHFNTELENFRNNIEKLKSAGSVDSENKLIVYDPVEVEIQGNHISWYPLEKGQNVYADSPGTIEEVTPELKNLKGIMLNDKDQQKEGTILHFNNKQPVKVLVGYFNTNSYSVLNPPTLETDAMANDRGQADIRIANAIRMNGLYPVNVYTYHYEAGENELKLGKGRVLILGFIDGKYDIKIHDAGITDSDDGLPVDWLFY